MANRSSHRAPCTTVPTVVLLGGQDDPTEGKLRHDWEKICAQLPQHVLAIATWSDRPDARRPHTKKKSAAPKAERVPDWIDRTLARWVTRLVAALDACTRFDDHGNPMTLRTKLVLRFTRFSVAVLYDRAGLRGQVVDRAMQRILEARGPVVIVAHSLGGSIAKMALWKLWSLGDRRRFALLTLGTNCGSTLARSPFFARLPPTPDGKIPPPPNVSSWTHAQSPRDAFVAAPAPPCAFAGVAVMPVAGGRFLGKSHGHGLVQYLSAAPVLEHLRALLTAHEQSTDSPSDATRAPMDRPREQRVPTVARAAVSASPSSASSAAISSENTRTGLRS